MSFSPEQFVAFIVVSFVILLIGTLIGAIILRLAVSLYNTLAGIANSPTAVPKPSFIKAIGISFVTMLAKIVLGAVVGLVIRGAPLAAGARGRGLNINVPAELVSFAIGVLVMAGLLAVLLPTTFGRAIIVSLCEVLIVTVILGIVILLAVVGPLGLTR